jgi:hypothetical protein
MDNVKSEKRYAFTTFIHSLHDFEQAQNRGKGLGAMSLFKVGYRFV